MSPGRPGRVCRTVGPVIWAAASADLPGGPPRWHGRGGSARSLAGVFDTEFFPLGSGLEIWLVPTPEESMLAAV